VITLATQKRWRVKHLDFKTVYLGIEFTYQEEGIFVSQYRYIQHLLEHFRMTYWYISKVPMHEGTKLCCHMETRETNEYEYRSLVGIYYVSPILTQSLVLLLGV
jgi:hypothetical protein